LQQENAAKIIQKSVRKTQANKRLKQQNAAKLIQKKVRENQANKRLKDEQEEKTKKVEAFQEKKNFRTKQNAFEALRHHNIIQKSLETQAAWKGEETIKKNAFQRLKIGALSPPNFLIWKAKQFGKELTTIVKDDELVPRPFLQAINSELNHRFHQKDMSWGRAATIIRTYKKNNYKAPKPETPKPPKSNKYGVVTPSSEKSADSPFFMMPSLDELGKKKVNRVSDVSAVAEEPNEKVPPSNTKGKSKTMLL